MPDPTTPDPAAPDPTTPDPSRARPTVLVIEDDRAIRHMLELLLLRADVEVLTAGDGLEGLLKVEIHRPDVVVLDMMMPDLGGMRVLDVMAAEHASIPIIVVTGKPDAAAEARARVGAANVFAKPFDIDDLLARIVQIVEPSSC